MAPALRWCPPDHPAGRCYCRCRGTRRGTRWTFVLSARQAPRPSSLCGFRSRRANCTRVATARARSMAARLRVTNDCQSRKVREILVPASTQCRAADTQCPGILGCTYGALEGAGVVLHGQLRHHLDVHAELLGSRAQLLQISQVRARRATPECHPLRANGSIPEIHTYRAGAAPSLAKSWQYPCRSMGSRKRASQRQQLPAAVLFAS